LRTLQRQSRVIGERSEDGTIVLRGRQTAKRKDANGVTDAERAIVRNSPDDSVSVQC